MNYIRDQPAAPDTVRRSKVTRLSQLPGVGGGGGGGGSRRGRGGGQGPLRVVVDLREFRSVLPNLLHQVICVYVCFLVFSARVRAGRKR